MSGAIRHPARWRSAATLMRAALLVTLLSTLLAAFAGCGSREETPPAARNEHAAPLKIRIGADSYAFSFQFRVARAAGIFKKHDIDAEVSTYSFGIDTINAAILGETDSAEGMDYAVASRFADNSTLRVVAHIGGPGPNGEKLYTRLPGVNAVADLKGKTLGVKKGTVNEYIWGKVLELHGIDPKAVQQVYLGSTAELLAAYQAGEIDAFWGTPDVEAPILAVPGSHLLGNLDLAKTVYRGYLLFDEKFIHEHQAGVVRLLQALDEASAYIAAHPQETAQIIYDDLKAPREAVLESLKAYHYDVRLTQADLEHLVSVADWSVDNGLIKRRYDIRPFIDTAPLAAALPDKLTVRQE
ncbi:MAG: ABC transporter substrate-binding protein [Azoarcus sp.]|jgi:NitT/TauT family transport system substrate-binding protein|nr:ABC transporter substrate-binding protein [Azoarcus sp.]